MAAMSCQALRHTLRLDMSQTPIRLSGSLLRPSRHLRLSWGYRTPVQQPQPWQRYRCLPAVVAQRSSGGSGNREPRRSQPVQIDANKLMSQYALPALGILAVATLIGPLVGGLVIGALGLGVMIAAGAAALSVSWLFIPLLVAFFGMPALIAGGMAAGVFATAAAGALLLPTLFQLVLVGGGLWLGATFAQQLFGGSKAAAAAGGVSPDGTIDVEAESVDDWREEIFKEQRDREAELREFDDLLRRREEFKRGSRPPYS